MVKQTVMDLMDVAEYDRMMINDTAMLTVTRVTEGRVIRTGQVFRFVYFNDGTSIGAYEGEPHYVTVFEPV